MHGSFYVQLICPRCYRSKWLYLQGIDSTAADLLNTFWDFACPLHGPQHEKPLQVNEPSPCLYQFYGVYGARQTPSRSGFAVQCPIPASAVTSSSAAREMARLDTQDTRDTLPRAHDLHCAAIASH